MININKKYLNILVFGFAAVVFFAIAGMALAQESTVKKAGANISYPVAELGNCGSETECRAFCDKKENREKRADIAKKVARFKPLVVIKG